MCVNQQIKETNIETTEAKLVTMVWADHMERWWGQWPSMEVMTNQWNQRYQNWQSEMTETKHMVVGLVLWQSSQNCWQLNRMQQKELWVSTITSRGKLTFWNHNGGIDEANQESLQQWGEQEQICFNCVSCRSEWEVRKIGRRFEWQFCEGSQKSSIHQRVQKVHYIKLGVIWRFLILTGSRPRWTKSNFSGMLRHIEEIWERQITMDCHTNTTTD